jgi:chemotaxis protein methyltransferase WspC
MAFVEFENILNASIGLDVGSIGTAAVARAVQERQAACGLNDPAAYLERVRSVAGELQALIEIVVVPETWFFRDREAFDLLAHVARDEWPLAHPSGAMRLLSVPSSTGEEPYSMAMALIDAGIPPQRFRVDAIDVSARALARAAGAVYGQNAFRGGDLTFRDRHFERTAGGHRLAESVRGQVDFAQGNLLDDRFLPGLESYDIIFCRNVLIYFDAATQTRALGVLTRLLAADGVVFVAPAETGLMLNHGFVSARVPMAFAFRKREAKVAGLKPCATAATVPAPTPPTVTQAFKPATPSAVAQAFRPAKPATANAAPVTQGVSPAKPPNEGIEEATRLADQGRFVEAAACCAAHLVKEGPSAKAFYLMGLVRDATGDPAAAAGFYRKALYLDPAHHDAQIQLAFLMEHEGHAAEAQVLRNRARRLETIPKERP